METTRADPLAARVRHDACTACIEAVETALEMGYRHVDTAPMYRDDVEIDAAPEPVPLIRQPRCVPVADTLEAMFELERSGLVRRCGSRDDLYPDYGASLPFRRRTVPRPRGPRGAASRS